MCRKWYIERIKNNNIKCYYTNIIINHENFSNEHLISYATIKRLKLGDLGFDFCSMFKVITTKEINRFISNSTIEMKIDLKNQKLRSLNEIKIYYFNNSCIKNIEQSRYHGNDIMNAKLDGLFLFNLLNNNNILQILESFLIYPEYYIPRALLIKFENINNIINLKNIIYNGIQGL